MADISKDLQARVLNAIETRHTLLIQGGNSKSFLGNPCDAEILSLQHHRGILHYEPTELVLTARAGTPLQEIEQCLEEHQQMLGFEPPRFADTATLGGAIACNLSGPRRPFCGAARDFVLGSRILNGRGEILRFGGEVMKNVAGYDASRLMSGSYGTLAALLEFSIRVLPRPASSLTIQKEISMDMALDVMSRWCQRPFPISAVCHDGSSLYFRLSGNEQAVNAARKKIGGEIVHEDHRFWRKIREQEHAFFSSKKPLWRISMAPADPMLPLEGKWLLDWAGAQRWLISRQSPELIRKAVEQAGGHATLFKTGEQGNDHTERFHPLPPAMFKVHQQMKKAFDPHGIFNPGRLYREL